MVWDGKIGLFPSIELHNRLLYHDFFSGKEKKDIHTKTTTYCNMFGEVIFIIALLLTMPLCLCRER